MEAPDCVPDYIHFQILLENILPAHLAEHFLSRKMTQGGLYHERYNCVGVMFASIPNYHEFYDETDVNKQGLECLRLLNEIICDFDKVGNFIRAVCPHISFAPVARSSASQSSDL